MADTANIAIDLSNGETITGTVSAGYRLVIATNEGSSRQLKLNQWPENYPVILSDNFCVEYYQQSSLLHIVKATPYNITGRLYLRLTSTVPNMTIVPSAALLTSANMAPVLFRISGGRADFTMSLTDTVNNKVPVVTFQSQQQGEDYHVTANLGDSRLSTQYVVTIPNDGQGHNLSQGTAPMVKLPYCAPAASGESVWKI